MRALIAATAAVLVAVAIGVWSKSGSRPTTEISVSRATLGPSLSQPPKLAPTISILEMHNQAHLENLPVQELDDKTFIFTAEAPR